jgi:phosphoribosyl-dephospho-CoA transferase
MAVGNGAKLPRNSGRGQGGVRKCTACQRTACICNRGVKVTAKGVKPAKKR